MACLKDSCPVRDFVDDRLKPTTRKITMKAQLLTPTAQLPKIATKDSAGFDFRADITERYYIAPGGTVIIPTGVAVALDKGTVGLLYVRSGLATKRGLSLANSVGVIDADYRGEVKVALWNKTDEIQTVEPGERIAQLVITPHLTPEFELVDSLEETERGTGGFGSTGSH